jgi:hypothetical protein
MALVSNRNKLFVYVYTEFRDGHQGGRHIHRIVAVAPVQELPSSIHEVFRIDYFQEGRSP